jgi:hypothetical protein
MYRGGSRTEVNDMLKEALPASSCSYPPVARLPGLIWYGIRVPAYFEAKRVPQKPHVFCGSAAFR